MVLSTYVAVAIVNLSHVTKEVLPLGSNLLIRN